MNKPAGSFTAEWRRVQGRSEFIEWWADIEPDLLRMAMSFGLRDLAQDVVQDVAIMALKQSHRFSELPEFKKWAKARVYWLALDQLSREARQGASIDTVIATAGVGPEQEQLARATELREHIQKLPLRQRDVTNRSLQGQSVTEIAANLEIETATVRSLLRFARVSLFRRMVEGEQR